MHSENRHKLTVIIHKDQNTFNVVVMSYQIFSIYVQWQIDKMLKIFRNFARVYVNDIVVFSKFYDKHLFYLQSVFELFLKNKIFINLTKVFIDFSSVKLLNQNVNFLKLFISEKKIKAVFKLIFLANFNQFETYFEFTD